MRIITINRQFGSGGREVGKRLSDILGWDYYDKEILEKLSENNNQEELDFMLMNHIWSTDPLTFENSFSYMDYDMELRTLKVIQENDLIRKLAARGRDCIFVGRNADVVLEEYRPLRIYVCADIDSRLKRCMLREEAKPADSRLNQKQILRNIHSIDRNRSFDRKLLTRRTDNDSIMYDLTVNATYRTQKQLAALVADFALRWFEMGEENQEVKEKQET